MSELLIEFCDEKTYSDRYFIEGFATTTSFPFLNLWTDSKEWLSCNNNTMDIMIYKL